jgi:hypothetical protein
MADAPVKKEEEGPSFWAHLLDWDKTEWTIIAVLAFLLLARAQRFFAAKNTGSASGTNLSAGTTSYFASWLASHPWVVAFWDSVRLWFAEFYRSFAAVSAGFCVLMVALIAYIAFRQYEVYQDWRKKLYPQPPAPGASGNAGATSSSVSSSVPSNLPTGLPTEFPQWNSANRPQEPNPRWKLVLAHISSDNPSDWRLAILEADIILEETLDKAGYVGETVGDKLKNAERRPFSSLNAAWEAHKIRNAIAHEGQGFELNQREASRTLSLFEGVFRELGSV